VEEKAKYFYILSIALSAMGVPGLMCENLTGSLLRVNTVNRPRSPTAEYRSDLALVGLPST
jgi:hypothetical protein